MRISSFILLSGIALALAAAVSCSGEATPTALPEAVGDIRVRAEGDRIFVAAEMLEQEMAVRMANFDGVSGVDSYLLVAAEPNAIIGVSPGSPLLVGGESVSLASGERFGSGAENVAIPGVRVNANPYGFGMTGSAMAHRFQVGQTFKVQGQRLRVIGLYRANRDELGASILVPLSTAQRLFDLEGVITEAVVSVDPPAKVDAVRRAIVKLLEESQ